MVPSEGVGARISKQHHVITFSAGPYGFPATLPCANFRALPGLISECRDFDLGEATCMIFDWIGDLSIAFASIVMLLKFLDWLLSAKVKASINQKIIETWDFLDGLQRLPFLQRLNDQGFQIYLSVFIIVVTFVLVVVPVYQFVDWFKQGYTYNIIALVISGAGSFLTGWITIRLIKWTARSPDVNIYFKKSIPLLLMGIVVLMYLWFNIISVDQNAQFSKDFGAAFRNEYRGPEPAKDGMQTFRDAMSLALVSTIGMAAIIFWPLSVLAIVSIWIMAFILYVLEFVVRRIAEQEKGAIVGIGVIVGGMGAVFKFLAG